MIIKIYMYNHKNVDIDKQENKNYIGLVKTKSKFFYSDFF